MTIEEVREVVHPSMTLGTPLWEIPLVIQVTDHHRILHTDLEGLNLGL